MTREDETMSTPKPKKTTPTADPRQLPEVIAWRQARDEHAARDAEHRSARKVAESKAGPFRSPPLDMQLATLRAERAKLAASTALAVAEHEASRAVDALEIATAGAAAFEVESTRAELRSMLDEIAPLEAELRERRDRLGRRVAEVSAAWTAIAQRSAEERRAADLPPATFVPAPFFAMKSLPYGDYGKHQKVIEFALADARPAFEPPDHHWRLVRIADEENKLLAEMERRRLALEEQEAMAADYDRRAADSAKASAERAKAKDARVRGERAAEAALADAARKRTEPYQEPKATYQRASKAPSGART